MLLIKNRRFNIPDGLLQLIVCVGVWKDVTVIGQSLERTVVFIYAPTVPGQNVFIRGGRLI